jgi:hypothetical protein
LKEKVWDVVKPINNEIIVAYNNVIIKVDLDKYEKDLTKDVAQATEILVVIITLNKCKNKTIEILVMLIKDENICHIANLENKCMLDDIPKSTQD